MERRKISSYKRFPHRYFGKIPVTIGMAGGFWRRASYGVTRTAVTRNDTGRTGFNISEFAGAGVAAAISNTYHPPSDRTLPHTVQTWASMMGWATVSNVVKEFWPDIRRKVHQRKAENRRRF
jgi:hypothetical protein